jgi:hypothetical protein
MLHIQQSDEASALWHGGFGRMESGNFLKVGKAGYGACWEAFAAT